MNQRYVHLTPRLECALSCISHADVVADIGCDHGRFTAALIQRNICKKVIATDISEPSLDKARSLIRHIGDYNVEFRVGDGLSVFNNGECDVICMLGMGGTLMARMLHACSFPLNGAGSLVVQPMRAQADIRRYLWNHYYQITDDRIVREGNRYYQIIRAVPDRKQQEIPSGWPVDFFDIGFIAYQNRDPELSSLISFLMQQHVSRLDHARGTEGETILNQKIDALEKVQNLIQL